MMCAPNRQPGLQETLLAAPRSRRNRLAGSSRLLAMMALAALSVGARAQTSFGLQPEGATSAEQPVVVNFTESSGAVKTVEVLTLGAAGGDFAAGAGVSTCSGATITSGGSCMEFVTFKPSAPGLRRGAVVLLDGSNNVAGTAYISGTGSGGLGVLAPGNVVVVAGEQGLYNVVDDGNPATQAQLNLPAGIALDGAGNLYIADSLHHRIRMVCGAATTATIAGTTCTTAGIISTVAGNGKPDYTGDGGPAADATLNTPDGVAVDGAGNLYIADTGNNVIRMVSAATGNITTVAGIGATGSLCAGSTDTVGDGCPATQASLDQPWGVTLDAGGNLYIADTFNHRIREVSASAGTISTIAGTGNAKGNGSGDYNGDNILATAADLNYPYAVAFDAQGNMYIPDSGNQRVREVLAVNGAITAASKIVTFAGTGTQGNSPACDAAATPATQTALSWPEGVAVDAAGNVYIADTQSAGIRKVNAATGDLSTLIQSGCGTTYASGSFGTVLLYGPMGIALDGSGDLYLADYFDMVIREIQSNYAALNYGTTPIRQGAESTPMDQTVENDGNAPLDVTTLTAGTNTALGSATTCNTANPFLAVAADCTLAAEFAPAATPTLTGDQDENGTITADEDAQTGIPAASNPLTLQLFGIAEPVNGTTTSITSTPNPSNYQQTVTFTVTVTTGAGTGNLTGTVSIADTYNGATTTLAPNLTLALNGAGTTGTAPFSISGLGVGKHSIVASYSGDSGHFASTSTDNGVPALIQVVQAGTSTALTSSVNPSAVGASVTFTAVVTSSAAGITPDGTITFMDGTNTLAGPITLTTVGGAQQATYTTSTLTNGVHQITAVYSGDAAKQIQGNTSNVIAQDVQAAATLSLGASPNPANYGSTVTLTAAIQSTATTPATGTVIFLDNGVQIGTGTLAGNPAVATFTTTALTVGTHPITATYAGDSYNSPAQSPAPVNEVVNLAQSSTAVTASPSPGFAGGQETLTATVTITAGAATPTGTVTFTSGATTLGSTTVAANGTAVLIATLAPGNYQVVATYSGNTSVSGSASGALPLTVAQATTQTALSIAPSAALVTQPITFTAKVTGTGGVPTGVVSFSANGNPIGSAQLNASGVATVTTSALAVGSYTVTASYAGDTDDSGSVSLPAPLTVSLATTAVTVTAAPSPALVTQTITFTATVTGNGGTPTGSVNFIANGQTIGAANLSGGVATFTDSALVAATYTVTASYLGDAADAGSTSASISETVGLIPTQTDLGTSSTGGANPQVILVASVLNGATGPMPTGTVTFNNGTTALGAAQVNASGVATLQPNLTPGTNYNITAVYSGDADHSPSTSQGVALSGTASGFSVTVTPPDVTMKTTTNATVQVNLSSSNGFSDTVGLGCASLPPGVTCHFSSINLNLPANGEASTQLTIDTNNPLSGGASAMNRQSGGGAYLAGLFLPFSAFFGWLFWRLRRSSMSVLSMVLVLAVSAAALLAAGCSGFSSNSAAPGTYTIQVTGTGTNSNVSHYQDVTLTITQ